MNTSTGDKKYAQKNEKPSKVLLVCVYDTVVFEISNEIIKSKFDQFGPICKLLIFEKGEVTKFFIEYDQLQQALQAKKVLDGAKLCGTICKMSIYFSNFSNVDLKHEENDSSYLGQSGCFEPDMKPIYQMQDHTKSTNKRKDHERDCFDDDPLMQVFGGFGEFHRSKTDNPKTLQREIQKVFQSSQQFQKHEEELQDSIKKSIDHILGSSSENEIKAKQEESKLKIKDQSDIRSPILWFSYKHKVKHHCIYNLFSNFGNLSCIIIKKDKIYIKFQNKQFAAIVSTYLNNTVLEGNSMILKECPEISDVWKPTENEYCEAVYYDSSYDRFTPQRSITINPPSQTLHVSSMKKQICRENVLRDIFEQFGRVEKVHILQQSNQRNMTLIKYSNLEESFNAIGNLHNQNFSGRKMQISFTKSKI